MGEVFQLRPEGATVAEVFEAMREKKLRNVLVIGEAADNKRSLIYDCDGSLTIERANWLCDVFKDYLLRCTRI